MFNIHKEIERKFVLHESEFNNIVFNPKVTMNAIFEIIDVYFNKHFRFRSVIKGFKTEYLSTIEFGHGISRIEIEFSIPKWLYYLATINKYKLHRETWCYHLDGNTCRVCKYPYGIHYIGGVGFNNIELANRFHVLSKYREITDSKTYSDYNMYKLYENTWNSARKGRVL